MTAGRGGIVWVASHQQDRRIDTLRVRLDHERKVRLRPVLVDKGDDTGEVERWIAVDALHFAGGRAGAACVNECEGAEQNRCQQAFPSRETTEIHERVGE